MKAVAAAMLALLTMTSPAQPEDSPLLRYSLDNGLDVIFLPVHRVPKVVVDLSYRVGAMNEPPGRSGFAHLFEHLMFSGTPAYPNIDAVYGAVGVSLNAYTYDDRTMYHAEGMASALPLMLSVEADRMANQGAAITREHLEIQREVVLNEMRQNVLDYVTGAAWEALRTALFPAPHPYHRSVIGSIPDLKAATIEDVYGFFDTYYVPNNATLAVVGDFDPDDAKALIADTFGRIPPGPETVRPVPGPLVPARARLELGDRVAAPTLLMGWAVPPLQDDDQVLLRLVLELLGNPDYGVLRQQLVDRGLSSSTDAFIEPGYLGSRFLLSITCAEGADPAEVEAAARQAIAEFLGTTLAPEALERERRKVILADRVQNERLLALADNLLVFTEVRNAPEYALTDDPVLALATPEAVMAAARRHLAPDQASLVLIRPGDRGGYPEVLTSSSGLPEPFSAGPRSGVEIPHLAARALVPAEPPPVETAALSNGVRVVHYPIATAALNHVAVVSRAGTLSAPEGKEGIVELAVQMAVRGAGALAPAEYGRAVRSLGADVEAKSEVMASAITLAAPPDTFDMAVSLLADAVLRPLFDEHEWDVLKAATLDELALREGDLDDVATRYGEAALFPKRPGEPAVDRSIASVRTIGLADAQEIYRRMFAPANVTIYSVGSVPLADVVAALEREFGGWTSAVAPLATPARRPAEFPATTRVLLVPEPGATQSAIYLATPAPGYDDPARAETEAVFNILNYDFLSRINSVIREEKGYTYGTDGALIGSVRRGSLMTVEAPVERDVVGAALGEIINGFASLRTDPVREDELHRSVVGNHAAIASMAETASGLFEALWERLAMGSSLEEEHRVQVAITRLRLPQVRAQAAALASLDRALIVVVGDPDVVRPQLEGLGLPVELVERNL
ncbi:MAG TPA: insulinase family protein [Alphaproteobacteria bacterium]|nr:insulinase family protein [Alphaproteobacteria bacterium]